MKKTALLLSILLISLLSCKKQPSAIPMIAGNPYSFIRFWHGDTLINNLRINGNDTFFAFKHGDTSGIFHLEDTLYVFSIEDTTKSTLSAYISYVPFDTLNCVSKCYLTPYHYAGHTGKQVIALTGIHSAIVHTGDYWYIGI